MAAGFLPERGNPYAPCEPTCEHTDCASLRKDIESACRLCGEQIGYGARIYRDPERDDPHILVHADCLEDQIEAERKAR